MMCISCDCRSEIQDCRTYYRNISCTARTQAKTACSDLQKHFVYSKKHRPKRLVQIYRNISCTARTQAKTACSDLQKQINRRSKLRPPVRRQTVCIGAAAQKTAILILAAMRT
jgi:hypothetical protein